jgi:DNA polymerase
VKDAILLRLPQKVGKVQFDFRSGVLFITLPSGRKLAYIKPRIEDNQFGSESVTYMGLDAQKHWTRVESYGPKFVENITQAICRDLLSDVMIRLDDRYRIVAHVHDEVILEVSRETELEEACEIMGRTPDWLPGIELRADGFEAEFYQK